MIFRNKRFVSIFVAAIVLFGFVSFSCYSKNNSTGETPSQPAVSQETKIEANSLSVVESLQNVFRTVSNSVLPTVVELDVVETVKRTTVNPFDAIPFFFFGQPNNNGENKEPKQQEFKQTGLGSGVIVQRDNKKYYVLTNNHVAGSATEISVRLHDGRKFEGKLVGTDARKDIALVSFETDDVLPVAKLGDSDAVQTGDICFAMGTPLGYFSSVTQGIISATGRAGSGIGNISDFIQTDAAINQGNSGGPLVNIYGEIIGINTWIASQSGGSQGLGFAIPINNVKKSIAHFISDGKVVYGWVGVSLVDVDDDYKKELGVANISGAFVPNLFIDSPAYKAGIQAGDYIIALNGKAVKSVDQLVRDVGDLTVGEVAVFEVYRAGKKLSVDVKIDSRKDEVASDNSKLWPGFIPYPITEEVRKELNLDNKVQGVLATNILAKSPAAALRLQRNDIITAVNGVPVKNIQEFYKEMDLTNKKEIWFDVYNEGHTISTGHYKL